MSADHRLSAFMLTWMGLTALFVTFFHGLVLALGHQTESWDAVRLIAAALFLSWARHLENRAR